MTEENQLKWAWWTVGIVVPIAAVLIAILLPRIWSDSRAPLDRPRLQAKAEQVQPDQPAAQLDLARNENASQANDEPNRPGEAAEAQPAPRKSHPANERKENATTPRPSELPLVYKLRHGQVTTLRAPRCAISATFDRVLDREVITFVFASADGANFRSPIMSVGSTLDLPTPDSSWNATVMAIDRNIKELTIKLSRPGPTEIQ